MKKIWFTILLVIMMKGAAGAQTPLFIGEGLFGGGTSGLHGGHLYIGTAFDSIHQYYSLEFAPMFNNRIVGEMEFDPTNFGKPYSKWYTNWEMGLIPTVGYKFNKYIGIGASIGFSMAYQTFFEKHIGQFWESYDEEANNWVLYGIYGIDMTVTFGHSYLSLLDIGYDNRRGFKGSAALDFNSFFRWFDSLQKAAK